MARGLTVRERRFVDAYLGVCAGNGTEAVVVAGYTKNRKSASVWAVRLLAKPKIKTLVERRLRLAESKGIADAIERDLIVSDILRNGEEANQLKAAHELNKCSGRHSIKHVLDVTEKLSDIIAGSRGGD